MRTTVHDKKGRYRTMSEKKYTQEEIRTIVDGAIRKANLNSRRELSLDELENVSGGVYRVPKTHEEIDQLWDIMQGIRDTYGQDVAWIAACELNATCTPNAAKFAEYSIAYYREFMHDVLDGKHTLDGGLDSGSKSVH